MCFNETIYHENYSDTGTGTAIFGIGLHPIPNLLNYLVYQFFVVYGPSLHVVFLIAF